MFHAIFVFPRLKGLIKTHQFYTSSLESHFSAHGYFWNFMVADFTIRCLAYRFFVGLILILNLNNLHLDTKTTILLVGQWVHISWLLLGFPNKMTAILDFAWLAALHRVSTIYSVIFFIKKYNGTNLGSPIGNLICTYTPRPSYDKNHRTHSLFFSN